MPSIDHMELKNYEQEQIMLLTYVSPMVETEYGVSEML